jgi:maintenance of morphology protein 1
MLKDSPTSSILDSLTATLNNPEKKPSFIDKITVTDISLGEEFPIFSNCRVIAIDDPNYDGGRLQALMDVDLSDDNLSLAIETSLVLNYPKPFSAVLPVALAVSVVRFSGTLCISLVPGPAAPSNTPSPSPTPEAKSEDRPPHSQSSEDRRNHDSNQSTAKDDVGNSTTGIPKTSLAFSFLPDYRLELSVRSLIGSRSRLQDVPKVAQLVEARVQAWFEERVVEPRVQLVSIPGLWPRMGRTGVRGQEEADVPADSTGLSAPSAGVGVIERLNAGSDRLDADRNAGMEGLRLRHAAAGDRRSTATGGNSRYGRQPQSSGRQGGHAETQFRMPGSLPDAMAAT